MSDEKKNGGNKEESGEIESGLVLPGDDDFNFELGAADEAGLEADDRQAAEIRQIFGTAFPEYLQPVEEILQQILTGDGDTESVEALLGMLTSLIDASSRMGIDNVHQLLASLQSKITALDPEATVDAEQREGILGDLLELKDVVDELSGGEALPQGERKQTIISALKDKEGVGKLILKRLSAAGLVTVDQLFMARPEEIAAVSGIDLEIVNNILVILSDEREDDAEPEPPDELESLHEQVLAQLRQETEAQADIEELKAETQRLRAKIAERRAVLRSLEATVPEQTNDLEKTSRKVTDRTVNLDDLRSRRDALARRYAVSEEAVLAKQVQIEALAEKQQSLEAEMARLGLSVGGLSDSLRQLRRVVAKGRSVK